MSLGGQIVIFIIIWMIVLFIVLPLNIVSQAENKKISLGTDPGAPAQPRILSKFFKTTVASLIIFAIINFLTYFEILNLREFFSQ
jgi:predicted secreted protein